VTLWLTTLLVAGCGPAAETGGPTSSASGTTGATSSGEDTSSGGESPSPTTSGAETSTSEEAEFSWGLPGGDLSVDDIGAVFNRLVAGECDLARDTLPEYPGTGTVWTAGQIRLYQAAAAACSGDVSSAQGFLGEASVTEHPGDCRLYRAVVSVVEQRPQDDVQCPTPVTTEPPSGEESSPATDGPDVDPGPTP
jgi:hypothetical protein